MLLLLLILSVLSTVTPILLSLFLFRKRELARDQKLLMLFWAFAAFYEIFYLVYNRATGLPNAWLGNIYTLVEFLLISLILLEWQQDSKFKKLITISIPLYYVIFLAVKVFKWETFAPSEYNSITRPIALLILCGFALYTFQQIWRLNSENLLYEYRYWVLFSWIVYNSVGVILFSLLYVTGRESQIFIASTHLILNILHNLLYIAGIVCISRYTPEDDSDEENRK